VSGRRRQEHQHRPVQGEGLTVEQLTVGSTLDLEERAHGPGAFFYAWFQLFRTAQIHALDNQAMRPPVRRFTDLMNHMVRQEGHASLQTRDGAVFFNSVKVRLGAEELHLSDDLFELFQRRGMGGFVVEGLLEENQVLRLVQILVCSPRGQLSVGQLNASLREAGLPIRVNRPLRGRVSADGELELERRAYTFLTYSKLVVLYRTLIAEEHLHPIKRQFLLKKIQRTLLSLVDICREDDHTFLELSVVKSSRDYDAHHAANTAVLAVALAEKLGLSKTDLADVGMAAMFHDLGMLAVDPAHLEHSGTLDEIGREEVTRHPLRSVGRLLGEGRLTTPLLRSMIVAFEHHRGPDGSGYPPSHRPPHLFSRIVAIASDFDALTTERPWRRAYLPDEALGLMLSRKGTRYDPLLLKVFINTVGLYPVGTLVRLSTGELAVVVYSGAGDLERAHHPLVRLLDADGRLGSTVDLAERDGRGAHLRSIVATEEGEKYGYQGAHLIPEARSRRNPPRIMGEGD
jgi:HD-GYP domain-containing protein (c-di-GMP phosphodiesterase class II)